MCTFSKILCPFFLALQIAFLCAVPVFSQEEEMRGAPAEPADAQETRAQIALLEKLQPNFPDRGAILYNLAALHQHLGETLEVTELLKQCIALGEGFL